MIIRKLLVAFKKWQYEAASMAEQEQASRRALMRPSSLLQGFTRGVFTLTKLGAAKYLGAGTAHHMLTCNLSRAFQQWQYTAAVHLAQMKTLAMAMRNLGMFAAWNQWQTWGAEMRRQQYAMAGAVRHKPMRQLPMAFKWQ